MSMPEETKTTSFPEKLLPASWPLPAPSTAQVRFAKQIQGL